MLEMQGMITYIIYYMSNNIEAHKSTNSNYILIFLMSEHIFSYIAAFYRAYDIDMNG
jgi:hypothetical protein